MRKATRLSWAIRSRLASCRLACCHQHRWCRHPCRLERRRRSRPLAIGPGCRVVDRLAECLLAPAKVETCQERQGHSVKALVDGERRWDGRHLSDREPLVECLGVCNRR